VRLAAAAAILEGAIYVKMHFVAPTNLRQWAL